ncbi:MAG: FAD-dependent oxidoreductase [Pseudomonadales bacterium]|jgi:4-methylaminobutanoate oxidase (formaldehyde-forming)|nr:FAD-dependent oxidoreductase [Pseudomonadales bacterium]MDP6472145.1 FAD-dependent oxidoreductase [Pseudomonadales bacterium]MDP6826603.1 FAD-dependent oxidoreductase [Pseudomonadales bacterium]MDP6970126.1 FAD-dependent oxidoreductase [Pseudomonadales bacterium]
MHSGSLPEEARVVIVGGGVVGCSIAYHLTKMGWRDVILLERRQLTCGTTWHAAGLIGQLRSTQNMTKLAKYTAELYTGLEAETGQATGFKQNGSVTIATNVERFEELKRNASMAKVFGLQVDVISTAEIRDRYPLISTDDVIGGTWIASDGQINPIDVTQALARGARHGGARIFENVEVVRIMHDGRRVSGVLTGQGEVKADQVVLCAGMWSRELALEAGVRVPLHACEHFYLVTEPFDGVEPDLPVFRDYDACAYYKEDAGKILLGAFEPVAKPWGGAGIPEGFCFDELPGDFEHFQPVLEQAMRRMPALEQAGIQTFFCGPESFTPDDRYHIGESPELANLFVAAGFNSIGIQSAGGVGKVLSEWMRDGRPPQDLWEVDVRRNIAFQNNRRYLHDRVTEGLGLLYAMHWPFRQYASARGVRRSPFHDRLAAANACFGELAGWERPNWYAPPGKSPEYEYSWFRQNWFEYSANEHEAIRENVGVLDQTPFAKFQVQGPDAAKLLGWLCANEVDVDTGRLVYTQWLNERGGIESDLTVCRLADNQFMVVTAASSQTRDFHWILRHIGEQRVELSDMTSAFAVLGVMGPKARDLLGAVSSADLGNEAFPFGSFQEIEIGYALVRALRVTYVGELGWELHIPTEYALHVYDELMAAGQVLGARLVGMHAMNSLRIEKAYRHWGDDITDEDTPLEAGLGFAVAFDKPGGFIGRESLLRQREAGVKKRLVQFLLKDPEPLLYHNEPIWRDDRIVGYLTSGMYGHSLGGAVGLGYVNHADGVNPEFVRSGRYEIEVGGERIPAVASLRPMYDPKSTRIRA